MEFTRLDHCPVCGSEETDVFKKGTIDTNGLTSSDFRITDSSYGSVWDFSRCRRCSFVFSNPRIDEKSLIEFYSALEDTEYSEEWEGREKNFRSIIKRLSRLSLPGNTLLDVGAASGIFVKLANEKGFRAEGIEPSGALVKEAVEKFGVRIFEGTLDHYKAGKKFSVITLLDLIEHVPEPGALMKQVSALMESGGILVMVTPDISSAAARLFRNRWWHFRTAHVNFFSFRSLRTLLGNHGFTIEKKYRYAWNFSLFYILSRIFPSLKKGGGLQKRLKRLNLKLQLFDSWEIYARKN